METGTLSLLCMLTFVVFVQRASAEVLRTDPSLNASPAPSLGSWTQQMLCFSSPRVLVVCQLYCVTAMSDSIDLTVASVPCWWSVSHDRVDNGGPLLSHL